MVIFLFYICIDLGHGYFTLELIIQILDYLDIELQFNFILC